MEKDFEIYRGKKERVKSVALKAKKESSDDENLTSESDNEEYAMALKNFKKFFRRKGIFVRQPREERRHSDKKMRKKERVTKNVLNVVIQIISLAIVQNHRAQRSKGLHWSANSLREMLNNQKSPNCKIGQGFDDSKTSTSGTKNMNFVGSSAKKATDGSTIKVHGSTLPGSVCLRTCLEPDEWIKDSGCSKHMTGNRSLFSTYKAYDGGYSQNSKAYVVLNKHTMKVEESLNVTFDKSPPPTELSPLVDDDVGEEEAIRKNTKIVNTNNKEDEFIDVDEIINIKDSKNHPLDQVIENINQRTLRSQAQNHRNFFCFISKIEPKNVNEALKDECWVVAMQEELNQFVANDVWKLVLLPKSKSHLIIVQIYVDDIIFGSTSQNLCDEFAKIMHDEFEMSMMGELNFFLGLQIKQMEDEICFNQSKYIKEVLKKFGLEDSKPTKTSMSTEIKLSKDDEADFVDSSKYRALVAFVRSWEVVQHLGSLKNKRPLLSPRPKPDTSPPERHVNKHYG
nr:retrovirus-related Pol polyprotein from transposon TNT 1-94 [Tanacetum cinerariifolium]GEY41469.1 retrovirus-related Pol polyprotein from transposon TNT 1-94 [Tanacetum cinerariifolium]